MKKRLLFGLLALALAFALSGCSALQEVNNTVNYVAEANDLIQDANRFAEQLPLLAEQAIANPQTLDTLKQELESMRDRIIDFNGLVPPDFANELHTRITDYNEIMKQEIDLILQQINDNVIDLQALADAPILETIQNLSRLLVDINQLGQ